MKNRYIAVLALAIAAGANHGFAQTTTVTASYNGFPVAILPDDYDTISVAFINVNRALKMTKVTAKVQIEYPQIGDLNVFLFSPDGTRVKLLEKNCGSLRNVDTTFDDAAPTRLGEVCATTTGTGMYRGNEPLSNYNSSDSSIGTWTLAVENNESDSRSGRLVGVTLTITGTNQAQPYFRADQVLNSANGRSGAVAPGQVVSIVGTTLGPETAVLTPAGAWPTVLGDTRVNVNGVDVPIRYASANRLDVQMPFGLTGPNAAIKVTYGSSASSTVNVPVATTFPGIFALQSGGTGQAKAVNQDGTLNSILSAAPKGSVIAVYGIGLGAVTPTFTAGQVPPVTPLSLASNPVAASIGGVPAAVTFAGLAPNLPGLYQINIQVPEGATSGLQELVISNGGNASQGGLLVAIR